MRRTRALIVGGGPAGSAAAIALALGGIDATVLERGRASAEGVCGGFLSWDAAAALDRLGVPLAAFGARPITRIRLVDGARAVEQALPYPAHGISRAALDAALVARAEGLGVAVLHGCAVRAVDPDALSVRLDDDRAMTADAIILATGKHNLRGAVREGTDAATAGVGIRATLCASDTLTRRLDGVIELIPFDHGYAGMLLRPDGTVNCCLSVAAARLSAAGGIAALMADLAREQPAFAPFVDASREGPEDRIAGVPYGWRARGGTAGLFRVGDQAAVVASVVGDGIAIALHSGLAAGEAMARGGPDAAAAYQKAFVARAARPLAIAGAVRWAAERPWPRRAMVELAGAFPALVRATARATRIG